MMQTTTRSLLQSLAVVRCRPRSLARSLSVPGDDFRSHPNLRLRDAGDGWWESPLGLRMKDVKVGTGRQPEPDERVEVHYSAVVEGSKALFESTYQTQYPLTFRLLDGHGMAGLHLAVASMREGGRRLVRLPPHLHYGRWTRPPNATLILEVDLLRVGDVGALNQTVRDWFR